MKLTHREHAYQFIRQKLLAGELPAGGRISATALAQEIGISHIPIREAISQLRSEGLIEHQAHRGAFARTMQRSELVDLLEFRAVLEGHAAAQAARRISPEQLRELEARWNDLEQAAAGFALPPGADLRAPLRNWLLADLAFHLVLLRAAGNRHALRAIENARVMTQMFGYRNDTPATWVNAADQYRDYLRLHRDIYEAVRQRQPRAARRAMVAHMRQTRKNLLARFDWRERQQSCDHRLTEEFPDSMRQAIDALQQRETVETEQRKAKEKRTTPRRRRGPE